VQSVDLSGSEAGGIRQKVDAVEGQTYTLRFALAGNPEGGDRIVGMRVKWEGTVVAELTFDTTGHSNHHMGWTHYSFEVTATSARPGLQFISLNDGFWGPALDHVSLVPKV